MALDSVQMVLPPLTPALFRDDTYEIAHNINDTNGNPNPNDNPKDNPNDNSNINGITVNDDKAKIRALHAKIKELEAHVEELEISEAVEIGNLQQQIQKMKYHQWLSRRQYIEELVNVKNTVLEE